MHAKAMQFIVYLSRVLQSRRCKHPGAPECHAAQRPPQARPRPCARPQPPGALPAHHSSGHGQMCSLCRGGSVKRGGVGRRKHARRPKLSPSHHGRGHRQTYALCRGKAQAHGSPGAAPSRRNGHRHPSSAVGWGEERAQDLRSCRPNIMAADTRKHAPCATGKVNPAGVWRRQHPGETATDIRHAQWYGEKKAPKTSEVVAVIPRPRTRANVRPVLREGPSPRGSGSGSTQAKRCGGEKKAPKTSEVVALTPQPRTPANVRPVPGAGEGPSPRGSGGGSPQAKRRQRPDEAR